MRGIQGAKDYATRAMTARRGGNRGEAIRHVETAVVALCAVVEELVQELEPYGGIDFGSDEAAEAAAAHGISAEKLQGVQGSGRDGAILVGDVRDLLGANEDGSEEEPEADAEE